MNQAAKAMNIEHLVSMDLPFVHTLPLLLFLQKQIENNRILHQAIVSIANVVN